MTVRLNFKSTTPPVEVLYNLTGIEGEIVAPNHIADASTNPVGAGPMEFVSYSPGSSMVEKANPTYWGKQADPWHIGGVTFTQVSVGPPEVTALESGAVDIVAIQPSDYAAIKGNPAYGINTQSVPDYLQFQFRFTAPFDNLDVRKAVEFAINKSQINQVVQDGLGEVATETFSKDSPAYDPSLANLYSYNPSMAHQLLVQSGLPLPIKITMAIPGGNIASMADQGAIIQQNLDAVGFSVSIKPIPGNAIASEYYEGGEGNAFAAQRPGEAYPPVQINDQWTTGQFVAKYSEGERPDITSIITERPHRRNAPAGVRAHEAGARHRDEPGPRRPHRLLRTGLRLQHEPRRRPGLRPDRRVQLPDHERNHGQELTGYIARRLLSVVPLVLIISLIVFSLTLVIPGDTARTLAGGLHASQQQVNAVRQQLGLNKPVLVQYWRWLTHALHGNLGLSLYDKSSVSNAIVHRFPITLSMALGALFVIVLLGVPAGIAAGTHPGGVVDRLVTLGTSAAIAIPDFWLGIMLVILFAVKLHLLPSIGYVSLTTSPLAVVRATCSWRGSPWASAEPPRSPASSAARMIDVLDQDYIRTARAKGLPGAGRSCSSTR